MLSIASSRRRRRNNQIRKSKSFIFLQFTFIMLLLGMVRQIITMTCTATCVNPHLMISTSILKYTLDLGATVLKMSKFMTVLTMILNATQEGFHSEYQTLSTQTEPTRETTYVQTGALAL